MEPQMNADEWDMSSSSPSSASKGVHQRFQIECRDLRGETALDFRWHVSDSVWPSRLVSDHDRRGDCHGGADVAALVVAAGRGDRAVAGADVILSRSLAAAAGWIE